MDDFDGLIKPDETRTEGQLLIEVFTVELPDDLLEDGSHDVDWFDHAVDEVRESAHIYRMPCEWQCERNGRSGDNYVFKVTRYSTFH